MPNRLLLVLSSLLSILLLEFGLKEFGPTPSARIERTYIEGLGPWRSPNSFVPRPRYSTESHKGYFTNSLGMVDDEITLRDSSKIRIAFLGDSIIEGVAVPPGYRATDLLRNECQGRYETLNLASSGLGTVQELLVFQKLAKPFKPDVTVLAIFPGNDIADNYSLYRENDHDVFLSRWSQVRIREDSLDLEYYAAPSAIDESNRRSITRRLLPATYAHLSLLNYRLRSRIASRGVGQAALAEDEGWYSNVYLPPGPDSPWNTAWTITELAIAGIRDSVEAAGSRFLLMVLPDPLQSYPHPKQAIEDETGLIFDDTFDAFYPHDRLSRFADDQGIEVVELYRRFQRYQAQHDMAPPYFGFPTDGHWNRIAHRLAAHTLATALSDEYCDAFRLDSGDAL